jgi:hypothetical protein
MKLVVIYNLFDGIELLEYAAKQVREYADIFVHYQEKNWYGKEAPQPIEPILAQLKEKQIIDGYFIFKDFSPYALDWQQAKRWETVKRSLSKHWAVTHGYDYYLDCDVDEFYTADQFSQAKSTIEYKGYETTACEIIEYAFSPTLVKSCGNPLMVPFICTTKSLPDGFPVKIDPTRIVAGQSDKHFTFPKSFITMHHMESVRSDLILKYESTSRAYLNRTKLRTLVNKLKKAQTGEQIDLCGIIQPDKFTVTKTENIFGIPEFSLMNQEYDEEIETDNILIITPNPKGGIPEIYINHKHPSVRFKNKPINQ